MCTPQQAELSNLLDMIQSRELEYRYARTLEAAQYINDPNKIPRHWENMWWFIHGAPIDVRIQVARQVLAPS